MTAPLMPGSTPRPFDRLQAVLLACSLIGYPLVSVIPVFLEIESRLVSIPYRQAILAASIASVIFALLTHKRSRVPIPIALLFLIALTTLTIRYVNDVVLLGHGPHALMEAGDYAAFFFGVSVGSALPLMFPAKVEQLRRFHLPIACATMLAVVLGTASTFYGESVIDLAVRAQANTLNAISFASIGALLIMLLVAVPSRTASSLPLLVFRVIGIAVGVAALVISASKGPLIALLIALIARAWVQSTDRLKLAGRLGLVALIAFSLYLAFDTTLSDSTGIALLQRLTDLGDDTATIERIFIFNASWDLFVAHPMLGGAIVEPVTKAYPHNVLLEALVVGGVLFGTVVLALLVSGVCYSFRLLRMEPSLALLGMVGLFQITMSMISGSLYLGPDLWTALVAVHAYGHANAAPSRRPRPYAQHLASNASPPTSNEWPAT